MQQQQHQFQNLVQRIQDKEDFIVRQYFQQCIRMISDMLQVDPKEASAIFSRLYRQYRRYTYDPEDLCHLILEKIQEDLDWS